MIDRIKTILESHKGKKNSITSKEIAKEIGISEDDTHAKTRALILKCIEQYEQITEDIILSVVKQNTMNT